MKQFLFVFLCLAFVSTSQAKDNDSIVNPYQFETIKKLKTTSVKNQHRSGTCWSFASLSFIETEVLKNGGDSLDLSEMFVVKHCYEKKADKYVRMHGNTNFSSGGAYNDVFYVIDNFGLVPESVYKGLEYGEENHVHGELDKVLRSYVDAIIQNKNKKLSTAWKKGFAAVCDTYFGEEPTNFEYEGKNYTPQTFSKEVVGIKSEDYVSLTSFTHHPMYSKFAIEIPDNWLWRDSYNMPIDELIATMYNAIEMGYSIAWGGDVSHKGFSFKKGLAILPDVKMDEMSDLERGKWEKLTQTDKDKAVYQFDSPCDEIKVTQESRQLAFDDYTTTDDHGMHIIGLVKDQNGKKYFIVKNSWDTNNTYAGYLYMSEEYVKLNTINIVINKNAVPKNISKKLNL